MSTRRKRCRFRDDSSFNENLDKSFESFEDNYQLEEVDAKKILRSLKSEPLIDWEFLGRKNEFEEITDYLKKCILGSISGIIYISGSPGTGKTCTLNRILNILENNSSKKLGFVKPKNYRVIHTNASKVASCFNKNSGSSNGTALFVHLLELMKFQAHIIEEFKIISRNEGFQECVMYFMKQISNKRTKFVVFIDEIDLVRRNRNNGDAVLELFKAIINFPDSGLVLLAVSNTVQIGNEISKKIGVNYINEGRIKLMVFSPYSHDTLRDIVLQRIDQGSNYKDDFLFNKAGIELCVRKVANLYGDCRRTLDACYLTLGKFIFERKSQIQKEQVGTDGESESINLIEFENLSNVSTRENSPTLSMSTQNRREDNNPHRLRTRSMPTNTIVPIGSFQNVIGRIHQSSQVRLKIIKTLPLHQQYVLMGIVLAIIEEQNQTKENYNENFGTEQSSFSISKLTSTRVLACHSKRKYQQICTEFMTPPEEYKDMLDALESNNIISISNGLGTTKKSSSFHRSTMRGSNNKESKIELMFSPESVINALTSQPKLGPILSNLLP